MSDMDPEVEDFCRSLVLANKYDIEGLSTIVYDWSGPDLRMFKSIAGREEPINLLAFREGSLADRLRSGLARDREFVAKVARRLFQHAGFGVDTVESKEQQRTYFRRDGTLRRLS